MYVPILNLYLCTYLLFFRLWDLERDDNYVLPLDETLGFERGEMINCVSYCAAKGNCKIIFPQYEQYKVLFFSTHLCGCRRFKTFYLTTFSNLE